MNIDMQLKAAEARRNELERQHAEALAALRGCGADTLEAHQSRVRELEKKVALETVRCEELQLEMSTPSVRRNGDGVGHMTSSSYGVTSGQNMGGGVGGGGWTNKGTEIERIMAKIEQDNRILAELDHNRATTMGPGLATSASSHALGECSPPLSPITMSHTTPSIYPGNMGTHNSFQPSSLQSTYLPSNVQQNQNSSYNTSSYNTYQQHTSYSKPNTMMGSTLSHHNTSIGNPMGQTSASVLASNLASNLQTSIGANFGGTSLTGVGLNMAPSSYTTSTLGNTNTFSNPLGTSINTGLTNSTFNNPSFTNPISNTLTQFSSLPYNPATTSSYANNVTFSNPLTQYNSLPLSGTMSMKLKQLEESDLGIRRVPTPVTPHNNPAWGLTSNLTGMTDTRTRGILNDGLDSEWSTALHDRDRGFLNGHNVTSEGQVDMLDIPGKGRCSVYIARFSYEPEPEVEEELAIQAGDYLLVWGDPVGPGGFLDAELLDGRRGLVPSHFVQRLIGDDLLEFHQAVLSTLREEEINQENFAADVQRLNEIAEMSENQEDDGPEGEQVPAPRQLTLERQLNKSVLISWTTPENVGPGNHIESYHVYVDGVLKATIKATERTRALVEGVDSNKPHRISVRSVTMNRRTSRDAACTMIIGKDTHQLGPSSVRATNITSTSAVISWLPANSNHQHVVCVNNVEVRTVKPGVYRHTITGLTANTQYRVTVRAKHHRAAQNVANLAEELPMPAAAHTDFRTLPKGLPDPPSEIMVEPGPQDGTLLVTWHPIQTPHHPGSSVTGYAVYADGKKVTDVDSPTGDHALIDISKLLGLNPKHVTVRTKARDSQSTDSLPTPIPLSVLRGGVVKNRQQPHSAVMPPHIRQQMPRQQQQQQGQQVLEPEENLSDKEIFPNQMGHRQQGGIPSIEITKESYESNMSEDELLDRRNQRQYQQGRNQQQGQQQQQQQRNQQQQRMDQQGQQQGQNQQQYNQQQQAQQNPRQMQMRGQQMQQGVSRGQQGNQQNNPKNPPNPQQRTRWFFALFDYEPATMSPNPDACEEELAFFEGDTIKVIGDKDVDGFYWGECRGRRGYVPHNMVMEVEGQQNRDRWGDIYANMPVKRMVALYDYDPHELSPNVDAEQVELSFTTGQIINVYGEMDDDGFFMGEIDGVRGLVPSNFLTEAPDQYGGGQTSQSGQGSMGRGQRSQRGIGPGARGPPPPPRDSQMRPTRSKDACPTVLSSSQLDNVNTASTQNTTQIFNEHNQFQMAIKPTITTLGELYQQDEEHDDDGILERLKQLALDNLPEGWMDWQVRTPDIDEFVDPHNLDQVKFALPTVGIARAFNPDASDLMGKPYRSMKMKMLKWQFCRGLLYSPLRLCIRIRKSYEEQLSVLRAIHEMQPLLLTASEASQQLSESKSQKTTRFEDLAVSTRMDGLENKLDRTLEVLGPILKNKTIKEEQYEDDVGYSSLSDKGPSEAADDELDNQSQCPTEEQEASPELREQRLVSPGWGKIGYSEDQNSNLYSKLLSKTDLSFGTLCHAVLKQRQYLQDSILELSSKHAEAAKDFISIIEGDQSKFRNISDDILRFICGKRAEMVDLCGRYHQMSKAPLQKKAQPPNTLQEEDYDTLSKENPFRSQGMKRSLSQGFQIESGEPRSPQKQLQSRNHKNSDTTKPKERHQGKRTFCSNRKLICQEE